MNINRDAARRKLILPSVTCEAPEVGIWLAALSDCRARTLEALAGIGHDAMDWICPLSRNTIGTLLYHIAAIELDWLHSEILEREFPGDFRTWFPHDVREFGRVRHLQPYDVTPQWVVHHLLQHETQQRGQIVMLRHQFR